MTSEFLFVCGGLTVVSVVVTIFGEFHSRKKSAVPLKKAQIPVIPLSGVQRMASEMKASKILRETKELYNAPVETSLIG